MAKICELLEPIDPGLVVQVTSEASTGTKGWKHIRSGFALQVTCAGGGGVV